MDGHATAHNIAPSDEVVARGEFDHSSIPNYPPDVQARLWALTENRDEGLALLTEIKDRLESEGFPVEVEEYLREQMFVIADRVEANEAARARIVSELEADPNESRFKRLLSRLARAVFGIEQAHSLESDGAAAETLTPSIDGSGLAGG